jgi:hypothetical protein
MRRPEPSEYDVFYAGYIGRVPETDVLPVLEAQVDEIRRLAAAVPKEKESYRYAPGKWSVRQIFGHLSDTERLFGYRAACIARGDRTPLPGIEQDEYVEAARFDEIPLVDLADELIHLRLGNLPTFRRLEPEEWSRKGTASGRPITVRALAYLLAGHIRHHVGVFDERYGIRA